MWIDDVYSLVAKKEPDKAIDILFNHVDEWLLRNEFTRCNDLFHVVDVKRLDTHLLVALLSITLAASQKLPDRPKFVLRVERQLKESRPECEVNDLLKGLK
jgi:hypothetical protein